MYKYNPKEAKSGNDRAEKQIPPSGAIVLVEINSPDEFDFEWAGTKETKSKKSGSPMLQVHCTMVADSSGDRDAYGCGAWLIDYIMLDSPWTASRIGNLLSCIGYDHGVARNLQASDLFGRKGYVQIKHESYQGEIRPRIGKWVAAEAASALGLPDARSFDVPDASQVNDEQESVPF